LEAFNTGGDSLLLFAHRGLAAYFPENSLEGFRAAYELGFKASELDVRMTADSHIVVFHDENGKRLLGNDVLISRTSLDTLHSYPILFNKVPSSDTVLLLKDYLNGTSLPELVYIDIKPIKDFNKKVVIDRVVKVVREVQAEPRVILASSDLLLLKRIRKTGPGIRTALEGFNAGKEFIHYLIPPAWRPDYYSGFSSQLNDSHLKWLRNHHFLDRRIVYDVDSSNYDQLRNAGIRCMIIDYDRYLDPVLQVRPSKADSVLSLPRYP